MTLVFGNAESVEILDVQVLSDAGCIRDELVDEARKTDKYGDKRPEMQREAFRALGIEPGTRSFKAGAFTITWRGQLQPHTMSVAKRLKFKAALPHIVADCLCDTFGMFVCWK